MNGQDDEIDALLASAPADQPLRDEGFTAGVMDRIGRRSRRRRAVLTIGWLTAAGVAFATFPDATALLTWITPATMAAMMTLSACSSLVWIATAE